jgi:hypothetical protein
MTKPTSMLEFEDKMGITLSRNEFRDGEEFFYAEVRVGGRDKDGEYFGIILDDGPASGERYYI